ncbi:HNH endonuclease [bacterium]|nr:HNH endonuclease [bacterium]
MEDVVVKIKGKACTVPGCKKDFETLDHRVPWSMSGNTSVDNLFPMCESHNLSKGDTDYQIWFMFKDD